MISLKKFGVCAVFLAAALQARESVCLRSGFCFTADAHSFRVGAVLIQQGSGTLELPVDQLDHIIPLSSDENLRQEPPLPLLVPKGADELLIGAAMAEGLKPEFVQSVAKVESGLKQNVVSKKGALGLMQLMPATADQLGVNALLADQNAHGGAAYLRQLLLKYNGDSALALAAYNAGPGAVARYKGVPPYLETRRYIIKVLAEYERLKSLKNARPGLSAQARLSATGK